MSWLDSSANELRMNFATCCFRDLLDKWGLGVFIKAVCTGHWRGILFNGEGHAWPRQLLQDKTLHVICGVYKTNRHADLRISSSDFVTWCSSACDARSSKRCKHQIRRAMHFLFSFSWSTPWHSFNTTREHVGRSVARFNAWTPFKSASCVWY